MIKVSSRFDNGPDVEKEAFGWLEETLELCCLHDTYEKWEITGKEAQGPRDQYIVITFELME